jgi:hypothetical protein
MIKDFSGYLRARSNDLSEFTSKVAIATSGKAAPYFKKIDEGNKLRSLKGMPVVISGDFIFDREAINESSSYNFSKIPEYSKISEDLKDLKFIPKSTDSISEIKNLRFPIIAEFKDGSERFKTIGKLRKSERVYTRFVEDLDYSSRFKVLCFKDSPISIVEMVRNYPMDVDLRKFKYLPTLEQICDNLYSKYKSDVYELEVAEGRKGGVHLKDATQVLNLNPHQEIKIYEKIYLDHYGERLPNWAKKQLIEDHVLEYYKIKELDQKLLGTGLTLNYSKAIKKWS